ncbi:hypothetical protein LZZ85_27055 [Terrimonas sp. NA20]|uniref:Uncharacterized protein n=1 Tax=Terrimonas ginsenosidimutans TaxID=2908004 RepID=A0ABS9L052_9BACT|nr:hypothetical protein [Terrimonas ginsenosidimutans]MCG2617991.1 hypothetical protein [Terrimonas ginsenosidimutans]
MDQLNFHKQKLYCLIIAGVALIAIFLPWFSMSMGIFGGISVNGFRSWGILSFFGVAGVAAASLLGDKTLPFDETFKKVALGSFAAIALGALIFFLRMTAEGLSIGSAGFGLYLTLIAGALGLVWVLGKINLPDIKKKP